MCDFSEFVTQNSGFLLTVLGLMGSCCAGFGVCILRSRCTRISLCGCAIERAVLSEGAVVRAPNTPTEENL